MRVLSLALFCATAWAATITKYQFYHDGLNYMSCQYALELSVSFCNATELDCLCTNAANIASIAGCMAYKQHNDTKAFKYWIHECKESYEVELTYDQIEEGYDFYLNSGKYVEQIEGFNATVPVDIPIKLNDSVIQSFEDAYKVWLGNYDDSLYYGSGCIAYWGLVCIIAGICNWAVILFPGLRRTFDGRVSRMWRKYVTLPALWRKKKATHQKFFYLFDCLVPSRLESLVVFVFFWLVFALNVVKIYYVHDDPIFEGLRRQAINRYVADRTGIIATVLMPLLLLFGGRNNFLQWVTRWKLSTMLTYHRWIARLVVLLAFIHSVAFTATMIWYGDFAEEMADNYLVWGVVATTCGALICFQGLLFLRRRWYETFLVVHILLAIFFVAGTWYHVWELGYAQLLYPCFAVWAFDRVVRFGRMAVFGFPKLKISYHADETLRIEVPKPSYWHATPGGHAWIYFSSYTHFWQSHPFTYIEEDGNLVFYAKIKRGITAKLAKALARTPGKTLEVRVSVEGPYGETSPVKAHSDVVYVAGGNGIPGLYSELVNAARTGAKQRLRLVWIIREMRTLSWFHKELMALKDLNVEATVFVTRPDLHENADELVQAIKHSESEDADSEKETKDVLALTKQDLAHIDFIEQRPDFATLVPTMVAESSHSIAFVTCGNPRMVDDLRYQAVQSIDQTAKRVDFFEAMETWA